MYGKSYALYAVKVSTILSTCGYINIVLWEFENTMYVCVYFVIFIFYVVVVLTAMKALIGLLISCFISK